jgi:hypothetical protein
MATQVFSKYLALGTGDNDLNARLLPAHFTSPSYYTPAAVGSEATTMVSAHLKGIDTAIGGRLSLSGGTLTGPLDINDAGASGNSLRLVGSIKVGVNAETAATAGAGTLKWTGTSYQYSDGSVWQNIANVQSVRIDVEDFDVTSSSGQTIFSTGQDLTGLAVQVFEEGFLRRPGADYSISGTDITFTYTVIQGQWVSVQISNSSTQSSDFDVSNPVGETEFDLGIDLAMKSVQVYENGFMRRIGAAKDYTISGTKVIFNYTVQQGQWVRILVF